MCVMPNMGGGGPHPLGQFADRMGHIARGQQPQQPGVPQAQRQTPPPMPSPPPEAWAGGPPFGGPPAGMMPPAVPGGIAPRSGSRYINER